MEQLRVEYKDIDTLHPHERNARIHGEVQVAQLAKSIECFGFTTPVVVDQDNNVLAGHGRLLAARSIGLSSIPTVSLCHLTPDQARAYMLADNKLAMGASWDNEILVQELCSLADIGIDLDMAGFTERDMDILGLCDLSPDNAGGGKVGGESLSKCPKCGFEYGKK